MTARHWIKNSRLRLPHKRRSPALKNCPQKKAVVIKSFITTPRKPNSAKRKTAKVRLSTRKFTRVYFEGIGLNVLQPHSVVLVRGGGPRDLPGVRYHAIRGKFDLAALLNYRRARSKYGVKKPASEKAVKLQPLAEMHPSEQHIEKVSRRRFLMYKHLANLKYKLHRRQNWLIKARLPA